MRKGNTMKVSTTLLVLLMGFSLVACGNSSPAAQPPVNNTEEQSPAPEQQPDESAAIEAEGILTGWADPHTVEIRVDEKPMSFQVGEDLQKSLDDINDEDSVRFKYVEKTIDATTKQLVLTEIASSDDDNGSNAGGTVTSDRPKTSELEVTVEGMTEKRPVTLAQAKGYSLYVFEPMVFDAEDHELTMKIDPDYEVEIEKLPADFNLDVLKMDAKEELSETGEVKQLTAEQLSNGPMKDAQLYMMSQNDKKTEYFIVKELDGNGFVFHIHAPIGEPSEGFLPMAYASLNSIMNE
jgi:predicted small lipoprotein YifL